MIALVSCKMQMFVLLLDLETDTCTIYNLYWYMAKTFIILSKFLSRQYCLSGNVGGGIRKVFSTLKLQFFFRLVAEEVNNRPVK